MVEHSIHNAAVVGSIPTPGTKVKHSPLAKNHKDVIIIQLKTPSLVLFLK